MYTVLQTYRVDATKRHNVFFKISKRSLRENILRAIFYNRRYNKPKVIY